MNAAAASAAADAAGTSPEMEASPQAATELPQAPPADGGGTPAPGVQPPSPPGEDHTGWGEAFGPPYSAIFLDVDSKDTSVGMSCPPAAFLEPAFLINLKALLQGGGGGGGGAQGGGGGAGVLAINVAARSKELFGKAMTAVCTAFAGGEVGRCCGNFRCLYPIFVSRCLSALTLCRGRAKSKMSRGHRDATSAKRLRI